ncbi:hypothetical protein Tco_0282429 [Tanacetum coccineum]
MLKSSGHYLEVKLLKSVRICVGPSVPDDNDVGDIARRRRKNGLCPTGTLNYQGLKGPDSEPGSHRDKILLQQIGVIHGTQIQNYQEFRMTGPTSDPVTPLNRIVENNNPNNSPNLQDQILSHMSSLEALIKQHNERAETHIVTPIRLTFHDDGDGGKGKDGGQSPKDGGGEDLKKPYKERWTEEMGYIQSVPEVMQISAFVANSKCPELSRRFADRVPRTVTKMMQRVDDFIKSEEAYKSTELPKGEQPEMGHGTSFRGGRPPRSGQGNGHQKMDNYDRGDHYQPYVPPRAQDRRYDTHRHDN